MSRFAVIYRYSTDSEALDEHRPAHREFLKSLYENGTLVASGPFGEGGGPGALLLLDCGSAAEAAAVLDEDPFYARGLIVEREIRAWTVVLGAVG